MSWLVMVGTALAAYFVWLAWEAGRAIEMPEDDE
jgi:hypothetical protein